MRGRVLALMGYEIVEGAVADGHMRELQRVNLRRDVLGNSRRRLEENVNSLGKRCDTGVASFERVASLLIGEAALLSNLSTVPAFGALFELFF
ncbi:MAG: hypothetical protein ABR557_00660 [Pyrinomonadaceae bacterium]